MKKLLAILTTLALILTSVAALADTLVMGTNAAFDPFEYIGDDGEYAGFDIDLAKAIAAELGKELVIEDIYFDGLLAALEVGTVDFIASALTMYEERKAAADFTIPYYNAEQSVIVMEGYEGIKSFDDIVDKKVAVQDATTGHFLALDTIGCDPANVAAFKASADTVLELMTGRVDCIIIDNAVAANFVKSFDGLALVEGLEMPPEEYGMAVKKGNTELLDALNAALTKLMEDGTYAALLEKHL